MAQTKALDYHIVKSLVNRYFARHVGGARRPVFHDIAATAPALTEVTRAYPAIRAEFDRLLAEGVELPPYHVIDPGEAPISNTGTGAPWSVFLLEVLGHRLVGNRARCRETCRVLDGVPNLMQAFFSVLPAGRSIPLHEGPYLGYLRYHLALCVPREDPPILRVGGQPYVWRAGEAILFDDTLPHEVENRSRTLRAVLVVDVLRPMPALPTLVNRVMTRFVARPTYGRKVARRADRFSATAPSP